MPTKPNPITTDLHVSDVTDAVAACRELTVRSIGPCAVIVIEKDGPIRLETQCWSEAEWQSLLAWLRENPAAQEVFGAYYAVSRLDRDGNDQLEGLNREERHVERLREGIPAQITVAS